MSSSLAAWKAATESRATPENPSFNLQDPAAWAGVDFGGGESASGMKVTPETSLKIASVWQAVSMISGDVAKLPLDPYKRAEDDGREVDKSIPAWWLVRKQANNEMHARRYWRTMMVRALLWNQAFAWIERNGRGDPIAKYPLMPDRTCLERHGGRLYCVTETKKPDGSPWLKPIPYEDVFHITGISVDGTNGARLVKYARDAFGLSLARQGFASKFFRHGVRSGGVLELPLGSSSKFQQNVEEGFKKNHEGEDGWFKTVILRDGVKFHQTSFNAQEAQMNETSEETTREVARYYNMAPSRLGVKGSVSYNSKAEDNADYLDTTLSHWLEDICGEADTKLLSKQQQEADSHYFEHNTKSLLKMDFYKRVQAGSIGVKARLFTSNEWRKGENWAPLPGGDELPPLQDPNKFAGGADKGDNEQPRGPATDDPERSIVQRRVVFRMTDQARHKATDHRKFLEWLDGGLVSHRDTATKLLGDDELVTSFLTVIRVAEESPVASLAGRVDELATEFERRF